MSKAGRPKKDSAGLPDWFDIEKYRQAKTFGSAEWFQQLAFRSIFHENLSPDVNWAVCTNWMDLLKEDPLITIDRLEKAPPKFQKASLERSTERGCKIYMIGEMTIDTHLGDGVRPITIGDIYYAHRFASLSVERPIKAKDPELAEEEREKQWLEKKNVPFKGRRVGKDTYIKFAHVDLSLPDALLKKSFAEYLKAQRKNTDEATSPFFKNQDFAAWYNSGVLPYLDLHLWELESEETFRWASFVDALNKITDRPVGSEDACRKTAKALADKLLDNATIRMLNFQAVKEQEGSKKSGKLFVR